jgi:hypothetical protein
MKILRAVVFAVASSIASSTFAANVHAAPRPATPAALAAFATWHMSDLQDVTQAWYFTGEALSGPHRDGAPWSGDRSLLRPAEAAPAPQLALPPAPAVPAAIAVPSAIPEPPLASMLAIGMVLILLRAGRKEELFG